MVCNWSRKPGQPKGWEFDSSVFLQLMMSNTHKRECQQLGMHFVTARGRLMKMILLRLIKKAGEDLCFKCGKKITSTEDLSLDHKLPWRGEDTKLFWDLENVAFSHVRCNKRDRTENTKTRKIGADGTSWCCRHQQFFPNDQFYRNKTHWNGRAPWCIACSEEYKVGVAKRSVLRNGLQSGLNPEAAER